MMVTEIAGVRESMLNFFQVGGFIKTLVIIISFRINPMVDEMLLKDRVVGRRFPGLRGCI